MAVLLWRGPFLELFACPARFMAVLLWRGPFLELGFWPFLELILVY
jgi:hypothetical protein